MNRENVSLAESLALLPESEREKAIADLSHNEAKGLLYDWRFWARPKQLPPDGDWFVWLILTGRGWGKTRSGAEWVRNRVKQGHRRIALVAETAADARDVLVEGESGILAVSPPWDMPNYEPSKRRLTWPNGAMATTYSGEKPDQLRGPQHDSAWVDELAKYKYPRDTWDNLQFGLRLGTNPQTVVTTTPRPIDIIKGLIDDTGVHITRGSMYENAANLAPSFVRRIKQRYEGTRLGRQEIGGEVLDDNPDALWQRDEMIEVHRVKKHPPLIRIVVAVDPQGSKTAGETGIVVAGVALVNNTPHLYVLEDASLSASPDGWADAAVTVYHKYNADRLIGERNYGGDMVESTIRVADPTVAYKHVTASRGKQLRAEPVAAIYEQGRGHHVGTFPLLEDEMCEWQPGMDSPNRLDGLVWAATELIIGKEEKERKTAWVHRR